MRRRAAAKVIVLAGGREFWSNGMHLGVIEAAASPADASWANINAIDDVARAVLLTTDKLVIAALEGNAGAGGVFLALAADQVLMRDGIVLNPHYKNMGNLFGSEYWTYVLPRRVGADRVEAVMGSRLPMGAAAARRLGLADAVLPNARPAFRAAVRDSAERLAADPAFDRLLAEKRARRARDESCKTARRLSGRGARTHAARLLRLRSELSRGALALHHPRADRAHAAAFGASPIGEPSKTLMRKRKWRARRDSNS